MSKPLMCAGIAIVTAVAACADTPVAPSTAPDRPPAETVVWQVDDRVDSTASAMAGIATSSRASFAFDSATNDLYYVDPGAGTIVRRSALGAAPRTIVGGLRRNRPIDVYGVASNGAVLYGYPVDSRSDGSLIFHELVRASPSTHVSEPTGGRIGYFTRLSPDLQMMITDTMFATSPAFSVTIQYDLGARVARARPALPTSTASPHLGVSNGGTVLTLYWAGGTLLQTNRDGRTTAALALPRCNGHWRAGWSYCGEWFRGWEGDTAIVDHIECSTDGVPPRRVVHRRARVPSTRGWELLGSADLPECPRALHAQHGRTLLVWPDPMSGGATDGHWKRRPRFALAEWNPAGTLMVLGRMQGDRPIANWHSIDHMLLSPDGRTVVTRDIDAIFIGRVP